MSKIQILKAIHNLITSQTKPQFTVYDVKDTNFESNSQPRVLQSDIEDDCLRCQRYKFWKQFTTSFVFDAVAKRLFTMSKIQILKAIHNMLCLIVCTVTTVYDVKDTNFESNSQPTGYFTITRRNCLRCQRYKFWKQFTTLPSRYLSSSYCLRCQRYKFWKQFTTKCVDMHSPLRLFTMSKIQILKAIHNCRAPEVIYL